MFLRTGAWDTTAKGATPLVAEPEREMTNRAF